MPKKFFLLARNVTRNLTFCIARNGTITDFQKVGDWLRIGRKNPTRILAANAKELSGG
jgi:hypothetical protein